MQMHTYMFVCGYDRSYRTYNRIRILVAIMVDSSSTVTSTAVLASSPSPAARRFAQASLAKELLEDMKRTSYSIHALMSAQEALTDMTVQETAESIVAYEAADHDKQAKIAKEGCVL